VRVNRSD